MNGDRLSIMRRLLVNYRRLQKLEQGPEHEPHLPPLEVVVVRVERDKEPLESGATPNDSAWARARHITDKHKNGWIRRRSGLWLSTKNEPNDLTDATFGPPLLGEWASKDGTSVHLRPDNAKPGRFRFHAISERELIDDETLAIGDIAVLCEEVAVIGGPRAGPNASLMPVLLYHVYWGGATDDPYDIRRQFYRFVGFGQRDVVVREQPSAERVKAKRDHRTTRVEAIS